MLRAESGPINIKSTIGHLYLLMTIVKIKEEPLGRHTRLTDEDRKLSMGPLMFRGVGNVDENDEVSSEKSDYGSDIFNSWSRTHYIHLFQHVQFYANHKFVRPRSIWLDMGSYQHN